MRKISFSAPKGILINYLVRVILLSIISALSFSALSSFIALKLDLDEKYFQYISLAVLLISGIIISYFSVKPFKNNGFAVGIISTLPLEIYSLITLIICKNNIMLFFIKVVALTVLSGVFGLYSIKKRKKIKVK